MAGKHSAEVIDAAEEEIMLFQLAEKFGIFVEEKLHIGKRSISYCQSEHS